AGFDEGVDQLRGDPTDSGFVPGYGPGPKVRVEYPPEVPVDVRLALQRDDGHSRRVDGDGDRRHRTEASLVAEAVLHVGERGEDPEAAVGLAVGHRAVLT